MLSTHGKHYIFYIYMYKDVSFRRYFSKEKVFRERMLGKHCTRIFLVFPQFKILKNGLSERVVFTSKIKCLQIYWCESAFLFRVRNLTPDIIWSVLMHPVSLYRLLRFCALKYDLYLSVCYVQFDLNWQNMRNMKYFDKVLIKTGR